MFDWIFFILAGNKDKNIVSNEFEIGLIQPWTTEVVALDQFKKIFYFQEHYSKYFDDLLSLPFGLLVFSHMELETSPKCLVFPQTLFYYERSSLRIY